MFMAHTISSSQKPLPRATIARFDNPPPYLKSFSKVFPVSHDPFGLDSYSDYLFQPWANPIELGPAEISLAEIGPFEIDPPEIGFSQGRLWHPHPFQISRPPEISIVELDASRI